jgi:hypothetical protein
MVGLFKFLYRFKPRSENFQEPVLIPFTKKNRQEVDCAYTPYFKYGTRLNDSAVRDPKSGPTSSYAIHKPNSYTSPSLKGLLSSNFLGVYLRAATLKMDLKNILRV